MQKTQTIPEAVEQHLSWLMQHEHEDSRYEKEFVTICNRWGI